MTSLIVLGLAPFLLIGCATGSSVRTSSNTYEATSFEQIEVLTSYPKSYETLGLVEASAPKGYLRKATSATNAAVLELKKQAAAMGADAVVLKDYTSSSVPDFNLGGGDLGGIFSSDKKHVTGAAIRYVPIETALAR